jgi:hypothetical protein
MRRPFFVLAASAAVCFSVIAAQAGTAHAQALAKVNVETTPGPPPNRMLLTAGVAGFALSYIPSVLVALSSDRSDDHWLYLPVAGPWIALGTRDCSATPCYHQWLSTTLLILDGLVQTGSLVAIGAAFLVPNKAQEVTVVGNKKLHFSPAQIGRDGYGLVAAGAF